MRLVLASIALQWVLASPSTAVGKPTTAPVRSPLADVKFDPSTVAGTAGYFRVGKSITGRWFLITPEGAAFYYRGVTSINRAGTPGGRRAKNGPYFDTVVKKYADEKAFASAQVRRLRDWQFNALGAWCESSLFELEVDGAVMPYTEITEFSYIGPQIVGDGVRLPNVYDPAWITAIDDWSDKICSPRKNAKNLIGYFTDNELTWAQPTEEELAAQADPDALNKVRPRVGLLQHCLSLPETDPAFLAAWELVNKRHNHDLAALSKAWGVEVKDKGSIRALNAGLVTIAIGDGTTVPTTPRPPGPRPRRAIISTPAFHADQETFSLDFAQRYFRLSAEAIRKHDPNHLILGCRFGGPPGKTVLSAIDKRWVDVVSANNYRPDMAGRMRIYHDGTGLPVLNGEFAYHTGHFRMSGKTPEGMAKIGADTLLKSFGEPSLVGYTWYRWDSDYPPPTPADPVPFQCGLVNHQDEPIEVHINTLKAVNAQADGIAAQKTRAMR